LGIVGAINAIERMTKQLHEMFILCNELMIVLDSNDLVCAGSHVGITSRPCARSMLPHSSGSGLILVEEPSNHNPANDNALERAQSML
jgi:hypothetical protein